MERDNSEPGLVETIIEKVKSAFGENGADQGARDTDLAAQARGEGAGNTSGTEADVNMFGTESDPSVSWNAADRASVGTSDSGSAGTTVDSTYESPQAGTGFAGDSGADPYANTPGTGFATGAIPTSTGLDAETRPGDAMSGISTEPSLGEGDTGATGAPVGEDMSLEQRSGI